MARVDFDLPALTTAFEHEWRDARGTSGNYVSRPRIRSLFNQMVNARRGREVESILGHANELLDMHGVEAIRQEGAHVDNFHGDIVATYVNTGDTYARTLLYDTENHAFLLTSYGDFFEAWEAEHPTLCQRCNRLPAMIDENSGEPGELCRLCAEDPDGQEEAVDAHDFDLWVENASREDGPHLVRAYWRGRPADSTLGPQERGRPADSTLGPQERDASENTDWAGDLELHVRLPMSFEQEVMLPHHLLGSGHLYSLRGERFDTRWRLVKDSTTRALIELDRYLESIS